MISKEILRYFLHYNTPSGIFFLYEMQLEPNCTLTMYKVDGPILTYQIHHKILINYLLMHNA